MSLFLYLLPIAAYAFYKWFTKNADFFVNLSIPSESLWSGFKLFFVVKPFADTFKEVYDKYEGEK